VQFLLVFHLRHRQDGMLVVGLSISDDAAVHTFHFLRFFTHLSPVCGSVGVDGGFVYLKPEDSFHEVIDVAYLVELGVYHQHVGL